MRRLLTIPVSVLLLVGVTGCGSDKEEALPLFETVDLSEDAPPSEDVVIELNIPTTTTATTTTVKGAIRADRQVFDKPTRDALAKVQLPDSLVLKTSTAETTTTFRRKPPKPLAPSTTQGPWGKPTTTTAAPVRLVVTAPPTTAKPKPKPTAPPTPTAPAPPPPPPTTAAPAPAPSGDQRIYNGLAQIRACTRAPWTFSGGGAYLLSQTVWRAHGNGSAPTAGQASQAAQTSAAFRAAKASARQLGSPWAIWSHCKVSA